jgi:phenylalanyl-tRNA synthetase beta chain
MKISFNWLKHYVNINLPPQKLADKLTMVGLEVDELFPQGKGKSRDWIFDLSVAPNRSDCLSHIGIAREVAAFTGNKLKLPVNRIKSEDRVPINELTSVIIKKPALCPRYGAKVVIDVVVKQSPQWLRKRLEAVGIRSINNIVDVTNYVMMECGQPLHAFDLDLLEDERIVVRQTLPEEKITTLDGVERVLDKGSLVICDAKRPVALAGIMGGLDTEVCEKTKRVLLEGAYFDPNSIRKTSKKLGLQTEASYRFERGIDPEGSPPALTRAAQLIAELSGGMVAKGIIDTYPLPVAQRKIDLWVERVEEILGAKFSKKKIENYLRAVQIKTETKRRGRLTVLPPSFRRDIGEEIDLIEEVARLAGYDNIPARMPNTNLASSKLSREQVLERRTKQLFLSNGFLEVINYSFTSSRILQSLHLLSGDQRGNLIELLNPLTEHQSSLRTTQIPGLLQTMRHNLYHKNLDLKIFELGKVFIEQGREKLPREVKMLTALLSGSRGEESWAQVQEEVDFYDLKGSLENILEGLGVEGFGFCPKSDIPYFHPGRSAVVLVGKKEIGELGEIHPDLIEEFDLKKRAFIFELNFDELSKFCLTEKSFSALAKFPGIQRDLSIIVDEKITAQEIYQVIASIEEKLVREIKIFDLYQGNHIPQGKKSLTYRIKYQAPDRTLTDEEVNRIQQRILSNLISKLQAEVRDK